MRLLKDDPCPLCMNLLTLGPLLFLPAVHQNSPSAHLLAAVQPIISLPPFLCSSSNRRRRRGWREGEGSSDIVIKESPSLGWARPLGYSHPVWLPDTLAFTHTPVCTAEGD